MLRGGALVLTNTHIYNVSDSHQCMNSHLPRPPSRPERNVACPVVRQGGEGAALEVNGQTAAHSIRVLGCYFDFNRVVLKDPVAVDLSHSMFLGGVGVELQSTRPNATIDGLTIIANQVSFLNHVVFGTPQVSDTKTIGSS